MSLVLESPSRMDLVAKSGIQQSNQFNVFKGLRAVEGKFQEHFRAELCFTYPS